MAAKPNSPEHQWPEAPSGFPRLWAATAASNVSDGVAYVGAPLLAAALTRDPALIAGLAFTHRLALVLFALLSGVLVDRLDRRRALAIAAGFRTVLMGFLGLAVLVGAVSIPLLYAVFFLLGAAETLFDIATVAILPALVTREELPRENARLSGTQSVANEFVGPPIGGLLFSTAAALPFLFGAGALVAACALIVSLRGAFRAQSLSLVAPLHMSSQIGEGVRWLARHRLLRTIAITQGLLSICLLAWDAVLVLYALERLGLDSMGYGLLVSIFGMGGVLGSLAAHNVIRRLGASWTLRVAVCALALGPASLALSGSPIVAAAVLAFLGFHVIVWGVLLTSLCQELTPAPLQGRVASVFRLVDGAAAPGALLGGLLASVWGIAAPFWIGAAVGALLIPTVWSDLSPRAISTARVAARQADAS